MLDFGFVRTKALAVAGKMAFESDAMRTGIMAALTGTAEIFIVLQSGFSNSASPAARAVGSAVTDIADRYGSMASALRESLGPNSATVSPSAGPSAPAPRVVVSSKAGHTL